MLPRLPFQSVSWFEPMPYLTPTLGAAIDNMVTACSLVPYEPQACMQASSLVGDVLAMENARNHHMVAANHAQVQAGFARLRAVTAAGGSSSQQPAPAQLARVSKLHVPAGAPPTTLSPEAMTLAALAQFGTTPVGTGTASLATVSC